MPAQHRRATSDSRPTADDHRIRRDRVEHDDERMALCVESPSSEHAIEECPLVADDRLVHRSARSDPVAGERGVKRDVEDDRHARQTGRQRSTDDRAPGVALEIRRVDDAQPPLPEPPLERTVEEPERHARRRLVGLVARDERPERVGREDLVAREVSAGEGRLAGTGRPDEQDDRRIGDLEDGRQRYDARRASQPPASAGRTS
jgi:hypothetical protein